MFAGSLLLGLIVGLMLVVMSEWADRSLRYGTDAERVLGVPVLAVVPEASDLRLALPDPGARRPGGLRRLLAAPKDKDAAPERERDLPSLDGAAVSAMSASATEGVQ